MQEENAIKRLRSLEEWQIPDDFSYQEIPGMRNECRMKLEKIRPTTLAQAGRIDGMTPSELGLLQVYLSRYHKKKKLEEEKS